MCVARLDRFAYTILPAIRRRRIAARSFESPATASCRACAKSGPSTIKCTVACDAICDATDRSLVTRVFSYNEMSKSLLHGVDGMKSNNPIANTTISYTYANKQYLRRPACYTS